MPALCLINFNPGMKPHAVRSFNSNVLKLYHIILLILFFIRWLSSVLYRIYSRTYFFTNTIQLKKEEIRERLNTIEARIDKIRKQEQDVRTEIQVRLTHQEEYLCAKLSEYLQSSEFQERFCAWNACSRPPFGNTWEITKNNITKAIQNRFEEFLDQWEREKRIYKEIHRQLVDYFLGRFGFCFVIINTIAI